MEMKDRISLVIKQSGMNKSAFASAINVSPASVSQLCSGITNPSKQTVARICEKFNINPEWLKDGVGEMRLPDRDEETDLIEKFMDDPGNPMRNTIIAIVKAYMDCDERDKEALMKFAKSFSENLK